MKGNTSIEKNIRLAKVLIHALSADIIDISCLKLTQDFYIRRSFQQRPLTFRTIFFFTIKCISTLFSCSTHQTNFSRKQWLQTGPLIYKFMKCREKENNRFNSRLIKACVHSLFHSVRNCIRGPCRKITKNFTTRLLSQLLAEFMALILLYEA